MTAAAELFDLKGASRWSLARRADSACASPRCWRAKAQRSRWLPAARSKLAAVQARIEQAGGRAVAIAADVLDRDAMMRAFDEAERPSAPSPSWSTMPAWRTRTAPSICRRKSGGASSAPISMPCSSGRRKRRAGCCAGEEGRRHRQHRLGAGLRRCQGHGGLCGGEGRHRPAHQGARARACLQGHPRQRHRAGLDRNRSQPRISVERAGRRDQTRNPRRTLRRGTRSRRRAAAAGLRCRPLHRGYHHRGRRRPDGGAQG